MVVVNFVVIITVIIFIIVVVIIIIIVVVIIAIVIFIVIVFINIYTTLSIYIYIYTTSTTSSALLGYSSCQPHQHCWATAAVNLISIVRLQQLSTSSALLGYSSCQPHLNETRPKICPVKLSPLKQPIIILLTTKIRFFYIYRSIHLVIIVAQLMQVVPIGSRPEPEEMLKARIRYCEKHQDERAKLYCYVCTTTICLMCFAEHHQNHRCANVEAVAEHFREQLKKDIGKDGKCLDKGQFEATELRKERKQFIDQMDETDEDVRRRGEEMKQLIDRDTNALLHELRQLRQTRLKQIDAIEDEIELYLTTVESFRNYSQEMLDKGTICDVCRSGSRLHCRSVELQEMAVVSGGLDYSLPDVTFRSSKLHDLLTGDNVVGKIVLQHSKGECFSIAKVSAFNLV